MGHDLHEAALFVAAQSVRRVLVQESLQDARCLHGQRSRDTDRFLKNNLQRYMLKKRMLFNKMKILDTCPEWSDHTEQIFYENGKLAGTLISIYDCCDTKSAFEFPVSFMWTCEPLLEQINIIAYKTGLLTRIFARSYMLLNMTRPVT